MVDIFKRKFLDFIKNVMAEILGVSGSGNRGHISRHHTEPEGKHCHTYQDHTPLYNIADISPGNADVNDLRHLHGDQDFHQHFKDYKDRSQYRLFFVFPD